MSKKTISSVAEDIGDDLATLRTDVAKLSELVVELAQAQAETAQSRLGRTSSFVAERWTDARQSASRHAGAAGKQARRSADTLEAAVQSKPITSLLIAVAIGLLVGTLGNTRR